MSTWNISHRRVRIEELRQETYHAQIRRESGGRDMICPTCGKRMAGPLARARKKDGAWVKLYGCDRHVPRLLAVYSNGNGPSYYREVDGCVGPRLEGAMR